MTLRRDLAGSDNENVQASCRFNDRPSTLKKYISSGGFVAYRDSFLQSLRKQIPKGKNVVSPIGVLSVQQAFQEILWIILIAFQIRQFRVKIILMALSQFPVIIACP